MTRDGKPVAAAVSYTRGRDAAPRVVASGHGVVAEELVRRAQALGVALHHDPDLALALAALELDTVIPAELYAPLAAILAYVYERNGAYDAPARKEQRG